MSTPATLVGYSIDGPRQVVGDSTLTNTESVGLNKGTVGLPPVLTTTPRRYHLTDATFDPQGRTTFAADGVIAISDLPNSGVTAAAYTLPVISVNVKGQVTAAVSGATDIGLAGTGEASNLLRRKARYTTWTQSQAVGSNSTAIIKADALVSNFAFNNDTYGGSTALATGTGFWTCQKDGMYRIEATVIGPNASQSGLTVEVLVTNSGLTDTAIARQDLGPDTGTTSNVMSVSCSRSYPLVATNLIKIRVGSYAGGSRTYQVGVTITFEGATS